MGCESPKIAKECLQSDLDELTGVINRLESIVGEFAQSGIPKENTGTTATSVESVADTLRRMAQTATIKIRDIATLLEKEFSKLS